VWYASSLSSPILTVSSCVVCFQSFISYSDCVFLCGMLPVLHLLFWLCLPLWYASSLSSPILTVSSCVVCFHSFISYSDCVFLCGILPVIKCNLFFATGSFACIYRVHKTPNMSFNVMKILWCANWFLHYEHKFKKHIHDCQQNKQPPHNIKQAKMTTPHGVGNPGPGFEQTQKCMLYCQQFL
jgi:hypothetical protein